MEEKLQVLAKLAGEREEFASKVGELFKALGPDTEESKILEISEKLVQLAKEEGVDVEAVKVAAHIKKYMGPLTPEELDAVAGGGKMEGDFSKTFGAIRKMGFADPVL